VHVAKQVIVVDDFSTDGTRAILEQRVRDRGDITLCLRERNAGKGAAVQEGLKWADGAPVDPAMWQDWLAAVQITCGGPGGETEPPKGRYSVRNAS